MTSSNVSKLLVQVNQIDISSVSDKMNVQKDKGLFVDTLKNVAGSGNPVEVKKPEMPKQKMDDKPFESTTTPNSTSQTPDKIKGDNQQELTSKVDEVTKEIKEFIEEELGITEQDFEVGINQEL